ncbi:hypothetical protein T11_6673 [Trichinella zimbabwensis]|uniref:Uncharacterized protein n=1 Tax=Trichinella zimbabwensis TaxID=268475 RepID=A0A0V1I9C4_9BILA|nr:hypothetical protein T11_6673 [Trichinella zimbabwensis]
MKSETKASIRCGNSVAEEFDVKKKLDPTLSGSQGNLGIDNGLLLCQRKISTKGEDRTQISVPRSFRSEVLCSLLDRTCADHLEEKRTLARRYALKRN